MRGSQKISFEDNIPLRTLVAHYLNIKKYAEKIDSIKHWHLILMKHISICNLPKIDTLEIRHFYGGAIKKKTRRTPRGREGGVLPCPNF